RGKQNTNGSRSKTWEELPNANAADYTTTTFSEAEGRAIEQRNLAQIRRLTSGGNSGKMESELGRFKETISSDERMSKDYYSALKNKFSHGSDDAKALFNKYVNGNSVENASFFGTAHFDPTTKKISMSYYSDLRNPRGKGATWFHEHGHLIDDALNNISDNKEFRQCLSDDWLSYMKYYGKANNIKTFDKVQTAISKDLNSMRKHSAVSDLLEGVSNYGIKGCAGHGVGYWSDDAMICSEAFAHMYEAQFDKTRYAEMQKYFPSALSKFESMIKEAAK
nr:hypothetical protein [Ruminococcus sp.]